MSAFDFDLNPDDADIPQVDDTLTEVKLNLTCGVCQRHFPGADRNGGHCSTCHLSFASQTGFDKHRTGKFENRATGQANARRCLTPDELTAKGWTIDDHHVVRMPAPNFWKNREDGK